MQKNILLKLLMIFINSQLQFLKKNDLEKNQ